MLEVQAMAHDVFISYSSKDKAAADAVCHALEGRKIRCWIAPRDVVPGMAFEKAIIEAINNARVFILIFSSGSNESGHVESEIKVAWKKGIPIIPFRIEAVELNDVIGYYIGSQHWLDAISPPLEQHLQKLCDSVGKLLNDGRPPATAAPEPAVPRVPETAATQEKPPERHRAAGQPSKLPVKAIAVGVAAIIFVAIIAVAAIILLPGMLNKGSGTTDIPDGSPTANTGNPTPAGATVRPASPGSGATDPSYYAMAGGNPQHTGVYSTNGPAGTAGQLWKFKANASITTAPAVYNGRVYAGTDDGSFYAIDAQTGAPAWTYTVKTSYGDQDKIVSSPAVADGIVYFGSYYGGKVYALDANTGAVKWDYGIGDEILSSPNVYRGVLYIGAGAGIYAIDAKTGAGIWNYNADDGSYGMSSVAYDDGIIVANDQATIVAVDAATGKEKWRYKTETGFTGGPAISDGVVYVMADSMKVYAFDLYTGDLKWKTDYVTMTWDASLVVANGLIFKPSVSGELTALDQATGDVKWTFKTGNTDMIRATPAIAGDYVYFGSDDGYLYAVNMKTSMLQWKYQTKDKIESSPTVANGVVYVGSFDHYLYALG